MELVQGKDFLGRPALVDDKGRAYERRGPDGFVAFNDIARNLLDGRQVQYLSRYLVPTTDTPFIGRDLDIVQGHEGDFHSFNVHVDSVSELAARYTACRALQTGVIADEPGGRTRPITAEERTAFTGYMEMIGAYEHME